MTGHPGDPRRDSARSVKCPTCGNLVAWVPENRWRPFCSERCRQIDLGAWASDQYRISGSDPVADDGEAGGGN